MQSSPVEQNAGRLGRFTASTFADLMTEPRSKADKEAGLLSVTARRLVVRKALERLTGRSMDPGVDTGATRRGLALEPAALHIIGEHWQPVYLCTWQIYGDNLGATPDALVDDGRSTFDLKCPVDPVVVVEYAMAVQDGDFGSLLAWDKGYAWQIMVQALVSGTKQAWLGYFTDRLPVVRLTEDERNMAQHLIDQRCEQMSQEKVYPYTYDYASDGYYYAAKTFTLTDEIAKQITDKLERCEAECVNIMHKIKALLNQ